MPWSRTVRRRAISANRGLALDHSVATVPDAALALALCGDTGPALKEMRRLAADAPNNTLANEIYLPEVKAAAALLQHHPEQVAGIVVPGRPLPAGVEGSSLAGRASLEMKNPQQAMYRLRARHSLSCASHWAKARTGRRSFPTTRLCLLGTARAQTQTDPAAAARTYEQLLQIWKNADADFIPAQEARREQAALAAQGSSCRSFD